RRDRAHARGRGRAADARRAADVPAGAGAGGPARRDGAGAPAARPAAARRGREGIGRLQLLVAPGRLTRRRSPCPPVSASRGYKARPSAWASPGAPSASRIPGRNSAPRVIAPPIAAAPTSVARAPIAAAIGAVSAKDKGRSPIEISQSRLETRPSIDAGTWR